MKRKSFVKNAVLLTATSLILKCIGMFFRIYVSGKIGGEGMGLYQLIISVYVLATTFATSGIIVAVTRLIAEESQSGTRKSVRHILLRSMSLSVLLGVLSAIILITCGDFIAGTLIGDIRVALPLKIFAVSLPFTGVCSCLQGYFVARRNVTNNNISQLFEQFVRIGLIIVLIEKFSVFGIAGMCIAIVIGDTVAEILSTIYLGIATLFHIRKLPKHSKNGHVRKKGVLKEILRIATPITAGRYLSSFLRTIENVIVPTNLTKFSGSRDESLSQFGSLKGMAIPIIFFPASFLNAFSTLMIPEMSEANAQNKSYKIQMAVRQTLRLTLLLSLPISALFFIFSHEIGNIVFKDKNVGIIIGALAPLIPFMYLESVVDGLLKGLDQQVSSLKYSVLDSGLRILAILAVLPFFGMQGFIFIMYISNVLTCSLNVKRLLKVANERIRWINWVIKPLAATLVAIGLCIISSKHLANYMSNQLIILIISAIGVALVYLALLFVFRAVSVNEIPFFQKRSKTVRIIK